jgi:hypothetical protein
VVTLSKPPMSINVTPIVASERFEERLRPHSIDPDGGLLVVPIGMAQQSEEYVPTSIMAAMNGIGVKDRRKNARSGEMSKRRTSGLTLRSHAVDLGFVVTDYKLQGSTADIIVLSLAPRSFQPSIEFTAVYVLASRVRTARRGT